MSQPQTLPSDFLVERAPEEEEEEEEDDDDSDDLPIIPSHVMEGAWSSPAPPEPSIPEGRATGSLEMKAGEPAGHDDSMQPKKKSLFAKLIGGQRGNQVSNMEGPGAALQGAGGSGSLPLRRESKIAPTPYAASSRALFRKALSTNNLNVAPAESPWDNVNSARLPAAMQKLKRLQASSAKAEDADEEGTLHSAYAGGQADEFDRELKQLAKDLEEFDDPSGASDAVGAEEAEVKARETRRTSVFAQMAGGVESPKAPRLGATFRGVAEAMAGEGKAAAAPGSTQEAENPGAVALAAAAFGGTPGPGLSKNWRKLKAAAKVISMLKSTVDDQRVFGVVADATMRKVTEMGPDELLKYQGPPKRWYILTPHSQFVKYWDVLGE